MYDAFQLGPITIQYIYIIFISTSIATYFILDGLIHESKVKSFFKQHYWTMGFIMLFSYKFSVILFEPVLILTTRWLYFTGGVKGLYLGALIGFIYLIWKMRKEKLKIKTFMVSLCILLSCFLIILQFIKNALFSFL